MSWSLVRISCSYFLFLDSASSARAMDASASVRSELSFCGCGEGEVVRWREGGEGREEGGDGRSMGSERGFGKDWREEVEEEGGEEKEESQLVSIYIALLPEEEPKERKGRKGGWNEPL